MRTTACVRVICLHTRAYARRLARSGARISGAKEIHRG